MRVQTRGRKPPLRGRAIRARSPSRCDAGGAALGWLLCLPTLLHMPFMCVCVCVCVCVLSFFLDFVKSGQPLICISLFHLRSCFRNRQCQGIDFFCSSSRRADSFSVAVAGRQPLNFFLKLEQVE